MEFPPFRTVRLSIQFLSDSTHAAVTGRIGRTASPGKCIEAVLWLFGFAAAFSLAIVSAGCESQPTVAHFVTSDIAAKAVPTSEAPTAPTIIPASHQELAAITLPSPASGASGDPVLAGPELSLDALLAAVEQRNPSLEGMIAAWQAAAQRYPQAIALDDPMFQFTLAPTSIGSSEVEPAYMIQASQKLPWYGKRAARGQVATAEASAAYFDSEEVRVRLRNRASRLSRLLPCPTQSGIKRARRLGDA